MDALRPRRHNLPADTPFIREVWRRYRSTPTAADLDLLCRHYLDLTRFHASCMLRRSMPWVMFADLRGAGNVGLLRAVALFDPEGPAAFVAFSWSIIRRAIYDEREALRPVGARHEHQRRQKAAAVAYDDLWQSLERPPSLEEFAARATLGTGNMGGWARPPRGGSAVLAAVDAYGLALGQSQAAEPPDVAWIARATTPAPDARLQYRETLRTWTRGMSRRERRVFVRYFLRGMLLADIAAELGMHRGTLSQNVLKPLVTRLRGDVHLARQLGLADYAPGDPVPNVQHLNRDRASRCRKGVA